MWELLNENKLKQQSGSKNGGDDEHDHSSCSGHDHHHHHKPSSDQEKIVSILNTTTKEQRLKNFGMFGFASDPSPGGEQVVSRSHQYHSQQQAQEEIPALFKQSWIDFFVSEVPAGETKPVPRDYNLDVPDFPPWLLQSLSMQELIGEVDERESSVSGQDTDTIDEMIKDLDAKESSRRDLITSQEALFADAEEVEAEVRRKERKAKLLLEEATQRLEQSGALNDNSISGPKHRMRDYYLQCVLHKQGVADGTARSMIGKALHSLPHDISVSGVKDFKGDTVQLVRIRNASPHAAMRANYWIQARLKKEKETLQQKMKEKGIERIEPHLPHQKAPDDASSDGRRQKSSALNFFPAPSPHPNPSVAPHMMLSHFSYRKEPLMPGNLEGNHFRIVLRDVPTSITDERLQLAANNLVKYGFPNFYGCQRFSWFAPPEFDPGYALLHGDILNFAFKLLEFTSAKRTLRDILQRKLLFPTTFQESFRRAVVKKFEENNVRPETLDYSEYLLSCPPLGETCHVMFSNAIELDRVTGHGQELHEIHTVLRCMVEALQTLSGTSRRLCCQSTTSFYWNLCLSERIQRFGLREILPGDLVVPEALRSVREKVNQVGKSSGTGKIDFINKYGKQVFGKDEIGKTSIFDVFHPAFQFHNLPIIAAPEIQDVMLEICDEYNVAWSTRGPQRLGIKSDFLETPRPICAKVSNFSWRRREDDKSVVEVEFTLGKGSYANVALREFLRTARACPGHEEVVLKPLAPEMWDKMGKIDPGAMRMTAEDLYPEWIVDYGMANVPDEKAEPLDIFSYEGEWTRRDERPDIEKWNRRVTLRNMERREKHTKLRARELFEPALSSNMSELQLLRYAGHTVPLSPNAPRKQIAKKVYKMKMKRERDPKRRRMLSELQRKGKREDEYMRASRVFTWTPQR